MSDERWDQAEVRGITHVRVYFADTDKMGIVYHGNYLTWFEIGRTEMMRDQGVDYAVVEERGIALPVTEAHLRVRRPAHYNEWIEIETRLAPLRTREVTFLYQVRRDGTLLVEGETLHVTVNRESGRSTRLPDWLRDGLFRWRE